MYAAHFGLSQEPFSIAPDPRFLYLSERHREALAHLLFGVAGDGTGAGAGGGFVLLTGDIGTGKTTVCRCFLEQTPAGCQVAYIFNPRLTVPELLRTVCDEFHVEVPETAGAPPSVKAFIDALNAFLLRTHAAGGRCVLVIDEAQALDADVLEQLRLLTNLETAERKLLQIVLIGQPELRALLAQPQLEQLAQRVVARYHLGPLTAAETTQYIGHRLAVAGLKGPLPFDARALARVHTLTGGVPRRINLLCGRALLGAWGQGRASVTRAMVDQAAAEVFDTAPPRRDAARIGRPALLAALGLLVAGAAVWAALRGLPRPPADAAARPAPVPAATPAVPAASPAAPPAAAVATPAPPLLADDAWLQALPRDATPGWRALAAAWGLGADVADPCAPDVAARHGLRCWRGSSLTLPELRALARPGLLTLTGADGAPAVARLAGFDGEFALLQGAADTRRVPLAQLARVWTGGFSTLWRLPPGDADTLLRGQSGPGLDWLAAQLARLDNGPVPAAPATFDAALKARLQAFQRTQGLRPDGRPGPLTLMHLRRATLADEPRLPDTPLTGRT